MGITLQTLNEDIEKAPKGKCPKCKTEITPELYEEILAPTLANIEEAKARIVKLDREQAKYNTDAIDEKLAELDTKLHNARENCAKTARKLSDTQRELMDARGLVAKAAVSRSAEEIDTEIKEYSSKIAKYREALKYLDDTKEIGLIDKKIKDANEEIAHLEWAVTAFYDGAANNSLGADGRAAFLTHVNEWLKPYGYELSITVSGKAATVMMGRTGHQNVPVTQVSKGELTLAQLAVASAWNHDGELPVLLDDLEVVSSDRRGKILTGLNRFSSVVATAAYGLSEKPNLDKICAALKINVAWLENGAIDDRKAS